MGIWKLVYVRLLVLFSKEKNINPNTKLTFQIPICVEVKKNCFHFENSSFFSKSSLVMAQYPTVR